MVVDRTANFILDHVDSFSLSSDLLSCNRNATDTLWSTFHKSVDVGLSHVSDNHQVVSTVPCSHSHSSDIVLESSGSDFSSDCLHRLRVDVFHELCRRKRNALLKRLGDFMVFERSHVLVFSLFSPGPASSSRFVLVKVFKNIDNI